MNSDLSGPGGGYMPRTIRRRLYANKTQNAVSRSDPLQGSDKNIKTYKKLLKNHENQP